MSVFKDSSDEKWICHVCTFKNWPKSTKCTMCQHIKSSQYIEYNQDENITRNSQKISSQLITLDRKGTHEGDSFVTKKSNPHKKWTCPKCTYLNWPKAQNCIQCHYSNTNSGDKDTNIYNRKPVSPISDNIILKYNEAKVIDQISSVESASCSLDEELKKRSIPLISPVKWICNSCTYENWPKSVKCVICSNLRHSLNDGISSKISPASPVCINQNKTLAKCKSPSPVEGSSNNQLKPSNLSQSIKPSSSNNYIEEHTLKKLRKRQFMIKEMCEPDWDWLNTCMAVVDGDLHVVETYLNNGGSTDRQLTPSDVSILGRPSAFEVGYSLVHLAVRFRRENILSLLLAGTDVSSTISSSVGSKRVPSEFCPTISTYIRRHVAASVRQRKSDFPCFYLASELVTFALPSGIEELPEIIQEKLFNELLDRDVQKELEEESPIINWSLELTDRLGSRLYALWNRTAGDCLLDSVLQATWGVFDRENTVRRAMADSLSEGAAFFYPRWKEYESLHAHLLQYSLDESQWQQDWAISLSLASQPGSSLDQLHIFALAHVLRRPIIVYGVKYFKSFRGEALSLARFEGVYLPLLWEPTFCWKTPVALGYTRGHFSALVPVQPDSIEEDSLGATGINIHCTNEDLQVLFLPLMTNDRNILPIHFLTSAEMGREEELLHQWLDCCVTESGILVAQQRIQKFPTLVKQMLDEWLQHYRTLSEMLTSSTNPEACESSDEDSDKD
ncbi:Ubiquitin thioesterase zranb1-B [Nymphon striatum]|nr:Ubiquitin thioesterase zranb1-B [Nymphon striatum]